MRLRFLFALIFMSLFVLFVHDVPFVKYLRNVESERIVTALERDAFVIAGKSEETLEDSAGEGFGYLKQVVTDYSARSGARVIVTDVRGLLIVSSDKSENTGSSYISREEIQKALNGEINNGMRFSKTLNEEILWVAVPVINGDEIIGTVRITYPNEIVENEINRRTSSIISIAFITFLVSLALAFLISSSVNRRLEKLKVLNEKFQSGDYSVRAEDLSGPSEIKALAKSFNLMAERISTLISAQKDFVGNASHQLRTPLTALRLRLEQAEISLNDNPKIVQERIEAAQAEVTRMQNLVEGLLKLSHGDIDIQSEMIRIDLVAVAKQKYETWRALADEYDVKLICKFPNELMVKCQPGVIEQIIDNFLDNAFSFAPPNSEVELLISTEDGMGVIHVLDRGPGVLEADLNNLTNRFWSKRTDNSGSGLGLAIIQQLLSLNGGYTKFKNRVGGGFDAAGYLNKAD